MMQNRQITMDQMETGQTGKVIEILGGHGFKRRLQALGIRSGKSITKISSMFMRGPVTIQIDNTQIAIGFGMASKILVLLENR